MPCQPRLPCRLGGGVGMADRELRLAEEGQSRVGREHTGGGALKQPRRQLALEAADLLAQRRRANAQIQRSAAHAAELDDPDEVAQLTQFHRVVLRLPLRAGALRHCAMLVSSHGD